MPRRTWKLNEASIAGHLAHYPCPRTCPTHDKIRDLLNVATEEIDSEFRTSTKEVELHKQMVNGPKLRQLVATMLLHFSDAIVNDKVTIESHPALKKELNENPGRAMGLVLGAISDFCFNMEYARRITDKKWSYCDKSDTKRVFYPYLGVCPHCILRDTLAKTALGGKKATVAIRNDDDDDDEEASAGSSKRYFGNKVKGHHVGRIGERVIVFLIDVVTRSSFADAKTMLIFDDQHDVDAVFFFNGIGVLAQIKASPLMLLPVVSNLHGPLFFGVDEETGLPIEKETHTFTDFPSTESELHFYFSRDDTTLSLGERSGGNWPYEPFLSQSSVESTLKIIENWISIYQSFETPKRTRVGQSIKDAYLTSGWGAPIDDNKTKSGLARSDNMMKGTYASLKYGAYYVQECQRKELRTALVANIDPAHQYDEYLAKIEDIQWAHKKDFCAIDGNKFEIPKEKLANLFDSVFTFNRQILNDPDIAEAWAMEKFYKKLKSTDINQFLIDWGKLEKS